MIITSLLLKRNDEVIIQPIGHSLGCYFHYIEVINGSNLTGSDRMLLNVTGENSDIQWRVYPMG